MRSQPNHFDVVLFFVVVVIVVSFIPYLFLCWLILFWVCFCLCNCFAVILIDTVVVIGHAPTSFHPGQRDDLEVDQRKCHKSDILREIVSLPLANIVLRVESTWSISRI